MTKDTYLIVHGKPERKDKFSDGREAGAAFHRIPGEEKPVVIKTEGRAARFLASTAESHDAELGKKTYTKSIGQDVAFREGWEKADRDKKQLGMAHDRAPVIEKPENRTPAQVQKNANEVSYSKNGSTQLAAMAEAGKTYQGAVIAITAAHIIQRHIDPKSGKEMDVAHSKAAVSGFKDSPESEGKMHEIKYPQGKAGLSKEISQMDIKLEKNATNDYHSGGTFAGQVAKAKNDAAESKALDNRHLSSPNELANFRHSKPESNPSQTKKPEVERER